MAKKEVVKGVMDISIEFADNGFVVSYNGEDVNSDWTSAKIIVNDLDALLQIITNVVQELR